MDSEESVAAVSLISAESGVDEVTTPVVMPVPIMAAPVETTVTTVKEQVTVTRKKETAKPNPAEPVKMQPSQSKTSSHIKSSSHGSSKSQTTVKLSAGSGLTSKYSSGGSKYTVPTSRASTRLDYEEYLQEYHRGTSPAVIEGISTHPLLYGKHFEPLRNPKLSARSKKVLRDTADLGIISPGLRALLEVSTSSFVISLSFVSLLLFVRSLLFVMFLNVIMINTFYYTSNYYILSRFSI